MKTMLSKVRSLKKGSLRRTVDFRTAEFEKMGRSRMNGIFCELCFCILTANFNAERTIRIQKEIGDGFLSLPEKKLAANLRRLGHRFPNTRAKYIVQARQHIKPLSEALRNMRGNGLREWIVKNVKGLGYKEASHFLRNVGYTDYAIIDFHIIDVLAKHGIIRRPKTLTKVKYLEIEETLRGIAKRLGLNLSELDLYLWYMETGKVLK